MRLDEAGHEAFQDFRRGTEKRDGSVRGPLLLGFSGFQQRHDNGMLPYVWDTGVCVGQVEKPAQVAQAQGTKVLQLEYR